jgi:hypothetical protein
MNQIERRRKRLRNKLHTLKLRRRMLRKALRDLQRREVIYAALAKLANREQV